MAHRILSIDDCWERAYHFLMMGHMRLGNRAQAIRAYQRAVKRLDEELDMAPSPKTTALYEDILNSPAE